jgi:chemotaxis protein MotB
MQAIGMPGSAVGAGLVHVAACAARRAVLLVVVTLIGLTTGGCVTQGDWDKLYEERRSLADQLTRAEQERDEFRNAVDQLRQQLSREQQANLDLRNQVGSLRSQLDNAANQLAAFGQRLDSARFGELDAETDALLRQLADQYPDLITYDADRGRLRFSSDLTFDSGSADVKSSARASLEALARILNSSSASGYEVHVVGHTDSQRISSNTARRHPTNMHLSCHRAISVRDVLVEMGVPPGKMEAAGWGEFRPLVANSPSGNTPQNRRVEIYLSRPKGGDGMLDAPASSAAPALNQTNPTRERTPDRPVDITK